MAFARYLLGLALAGIGLGPIAMGARQWRMRVLPLWSGAPARLAEVVIALAAVTGTTELLGTVGLFRLAPMTVGLAVVGGVGWLAARRWRWRPNGSKQRGNSGAEPPSAGALAPKSSRSALLVALGAGSIVAADWGTRTVDALHHGMTTPDTLWYHMPMAARFVQQGSITAPLFIDPGVNIGSVIPFYPANGELFHALGILFLGNDFLSPMLNLGWLALALVAAWCVGRPFGVAPVTLTGCAVLMATPGMVATQPGGAYTDITGLALMASAVALLVNAVQTGGRSELPIGASPGPPARPRDGRLALPATLIAALASGLALGVKFTFVAPVVALTVGVWIISPRGVRLRRGAAWVVLVLATGGYWYVRNLIDIGNPLASALHIGPIHIPGPAQPVSTTVGTFLFNAHDWTKWYLPGLRLSLGPAWWAIVALVVAGLLIGSLLTSSAVRRMLALVGAVSAVAFVFTPQLLTLPPYYAHVPYNFVYNLRYSFSAVIIGLLLLPILPLPRLGVGALRRSRMVVLGVYGLIVVTTQFDGTIWPTSFFSSRFGVPVRGFDSLIGLALGLGALAIGMCILFGREHHLWRRLNGALLVAGVVLVFGTGFGLQQLYLRDVYQSSPLFAFAPLNDWVQYVQDTRIAITGSFTNIMYPLDGEERDSNYVQVIGKQGADGSFVSVTSCAEFDRLVNSGHYRDVVSTSTGDPDDPTVVGSQQTRWLSRDPATRLILRRADTGLFAISIYQIDGNLDAGTCTGTDS